VEVFDGISRGRYPYWLLYTSNYVIDETATFLLHEASPRVAVPFLEMIRGSPTLRGLHVSEQVEAKADQIFKQHGSSRVSYTDCTTRVLMEQEVIETAFSFDRDLEALGLQRIP
jgi:predicted nucleic acid-binding protein